MVLKLLYFVVGVSYYKVGVLLIIIVDDGLLDDVIVDLFDVLYLYGLVEFVYCNGLDLCGCIYFLCGGNVMLVVLVFGLLKCILVLIGGGKDLLVVVEVIKLIGGDVIVVWVGNFLLIVVCVECIGLFMLNIYCELVLGLFELNWLGVWNGYILVIVVNLVILLVVVIFYGYDFIVFVNECFVLVVMLEYEG